MSAHKRRGFDDVYIYVFSTMLLATRPSKTGVRLAFDPIPMRSLLVVDDPFSNGEAVDAKEKSVFLIEDIINGQQYYLRASGPQHKAYWISLLRTHTAQHGRWRTRRCGLADLFLSVAESEVNASTPSPQQAPETTSRRNPIATPWHPAAARHASRPVSTVSAGTLQSIDPQTGAQARLSVPYPSLHGDQDVLRRGRVSPFLPLGSPMQSPTVGSSAAASQSQAAMRRAAQRRPPSMPSLGSASQKVVHLDKPRDGMSESDV